MKRSNRPVGLSGLRQAFDEARFGNGRTLNLRESLPSSADAESRADAWLRQKQVENVDEVLIVTGRGNNSHAGVSLVREAVSCLLEGIASAQDIDTAVRYGLAPRWALMGPLLTLHLAGGPGGMKGILDHAGDAIEEWWTPRAQPRLTAETKARLVEASTEVTAQQGIATWVAWRDEHLVDVIKLQNASEAREPTRSQGE